MKGFVKRSDVAYFRVQKYADKGAFLLHSSVFKYDNKKISGTRKWISKKVMSKNEQMFDFAVNISAFLLF